MGGFSLWHILLLALLVMLLFGGNRFSSMMGDVAKGLKSFKQGLADDDQHRPHGQIPPQNPNPPQAQIPPQQPVPPAQQQPIDLTPNPPPPPPSGDTPR